jgi:outer membrane protein assembly factor BamD (BamD/ComL family)
MKKFSFILMMAALVLMAVSCKETLPKRFDSFVNKVEKDCASYSEEDWNKANTKFEKLVNEFNENKSSYSQEEVNQINADIAKYVGLVTSSGINNVINAVNGFINQIPSFLEGLGIFQKDSN